MSPRAPRVSTTFQYVYSTCGLHAIYYRPVVLFHVPLYKVIPRLMLYPHSSLDGPLVKMETRKYPSLVM